MSIDSDLIRGHVDTIILKTLTTGEKYGYEIIKEIEQKSKGTYELKQPTLYSCLKRLENQGLISAFWKNSDIGGKRHYYRLTKKGRQTYDNSMNEWFASRGIIDSLMGSKPTNLVLEDETDNSTPIVVPDASENQPTINPQLNQENIQQAAQMVLNDESYLIQEDEPRDFTNENLDDDDVALLGDYYKTDENQINLFTDNDTSDENSTRAISEPEFSSPPCIEEQTIQADKETDLENASPNNQISDKLESDDEIFKNYQGADVSKYRQNTKDNYFEKISYGVIDENNTNISIDDTTTEDEDEEIKNATAPSFSSFNFFTNYPQESEDNSLENASHEEQEGEEESERLNFGFGVKDDDDMYIPGDFEDIDDIEKEQQGYENIHPTISIYGEEEETNAVNYSEPDNDGYISQRQEYNVSSDLKPYNIGHYTEPEYKEKLNQLSAYAKSNYDAKPKTNLDDGYCDLDAVSISELKDDFDKDGINVRCYSKPEKEAQKDKRYLLVNKIKFVTSWIVCGIMTILLLLTYLIAKKVGYTDLSLVTNAIPASTYFIFAWVVVLAVPIVYTVIFLMNKTKRIKPNYNAVISLVFALLFFIVSLNIVYTLNILNGFTKFSQLDYNHLLWLLPAVDSLLIVVQSLIYSLLFKTKRFNA